ncbi:MAG: HEPN domain-containing protein [Bryobacteraceae bacterium]
MPSRASDWMSQARRDLRHAQTAREAGDYEWACFAAQQAAEKAVKAVYQRMGGEACGHSVASLLAGLGPCVPAGLLDKARELDKHYVPSRYPNSFPQGAPHEYYTREEAGRAIEQASEVLEFCERHLV